MFLCTKAVPGSAVIASDSWTLESEHPIQRICRAAGHEAIARVEAANWAYLGRLLIFGIREVLREELAQPLCPVHVPWKDIKYIVLSVRQ
jgi:hypothetical protein